MTVCNTDKRRKELGDAIAEVVDTGELDKRGALALRGRLGFAEGQVAGVAGQQALNAITKHAYRRPFSSELGAAEVWRCRKACRC